MRLHFLFSEHPLRKGVPDPQFEDQKAAVEAAGFTASCIGERTLKEGRALLGEMSGCTVVYRGWMVKPEAYLRMSEAVAAAGAAMLTSPEAYQAAHYLPNWYATLADLTPETVVLPVGADVVAELRKLAWPGGYFLKDFVKSLKAPPGAIAAKPEDAPAIVAAMMDYRGEIEGGLCVRRVEAFDANTESRFFVVQGVVGGSGAFAEIAKAAAARIHSPFFSVDVVQRTDGTPRIVEIGDGQVSDLVGWTVDRFVDLWKPFAV
ncbi:MAG: ATP-grasp domain-containing protein [Planctomycetota bacterium]|nr:ATP-grasp domain-containing protein [Planctomycetota bacterium]